MVKDILGQEIKNGDFIISASKSEGAMVFGVMKDVNKQTRVRIDKSYWGVNKGKWIAAPKSSRMYTLERTLKMPDEVLVVKSPELFDIMNDLREELSLPSNRALKTAKTDLEALKQLLRAT